MKQLLTTIAAVLLVGCGQSQPPTTDYVDPSVADYNPNESWGLSEEEKAAEEAAKKAQPEPPTAKAPDTSIHDAAKKGNIEAVKQHLAAKTDVNDKDWNGDTPLYRAAEWDHKAVAELLIAEGADVNAKNRYRETPLHYAAASDRKEIAELLIAEGADVNAKSNKGWTPLHNAQGNEIVELLIAEGADVNAKNDSGKTPLDHNQFPRDQKQADLLRKHGGKTGEELKAAGN